MEVIQNAVEDKLIDGLSYKLDNTASYITERNSSTFWAVGSNEYSPTGVRVVKLLINGDGWLDPSTVKIQFDLANKDPKLLRPLSGGWCFFRRLRILCNGALIEDVDAYNHVHEMFADLQARHVQENINVENFGISYDSIYGKDLIKTPTAITGGTITASYFRDNYVGITANDTRTISFSLLSGILNQPKFLPLRYCPLTIELEVCNNLYDPIISPDYPGWTDTNDLNIKAADTSSNWIIQNVQVKCDICKMDNQLENEFAQRFLSGQTIPINYSTFITNLQVLQGQTPSVNITRALSRLKSAFLALTGKPTGTTNSNDLLNKYSYAFLRDWNDFYHPMAGSATYNSGKELEIQLQSGSKLMPLYPMRSLAESYTQLRKCMGIHHSNFHSIDIDMSEYRTHKFIAAIDCETVLGASFSGLNIKNGSLLTVKFKNSSSVAAEYPTQVYVILHSDNILNLSDTGVQVLN